MRGTQFARAMLAWLVIAATGQLAWVLGGWALAGIGGASGPLFIEDAIAVAAAGLGALVAGYLTLVSVTSALITVARRARGGSNHSRLALGGTLPGAWRRLTATAIGIGLAAGTASPALASDYPDLGWADTPPSASAVAVDDHAADAGFSEAEASSASDAPPVAAPTAEPPLNRVEVADEPAIADEAPALDTAAGATPAPPDTGAQQPALAWAPLQGAAPEPTLATPPATAAPTDAPTDASSPPGAPPQGASAASYTVAKGDSLWLIAAGLIDESANDAQVTQAWQAIYQANRSVIGQDPGLIFAGQVLTIPAEVTK